MTKNIPNLNIGIFSFFAGAGFLDLGFEKTEGYHSMFVNEFHEPFLDTYKYSRNKLMINEPFFGYSDVDICSFLSKKQLNILNDKIKDSKKKFELVGFIGGPPCPDFSIGGKNRGAKGENGKLSGTYIELIKKNKPDFFLFENVKGLYRTKKHREFFDKLKKSLEKNGYILTEKLINALEYGAPQDRERIILLGFKKEMFIDYGIKINKNKFKKIFNWEEHTLFSVDEIFSLKWPEKDKFIEDSIKEIPTGVNEIVTIENWFKTNDVYNHPNSSHHFKPRSALKKFQTIEEGDNLKKSFKRLHRWRYSPTAAYGNNEVHLHPYKARRISAAEALAIQSLPSNFQLPDYISLTNMFKTIGNGVPYVAAKGLAKTIYSFLERTKNSNYEEINSK